MNHDESGKLLHELRTHQIELDSSRARYFDLFDLAPIGYFTLDEKGLIMEANLTAETLLGAARGTLAGQSLSGFILPEDREVYSRHHNRLFETGSPQTCELRIQRANDAPFWVQLDATATTDAWGAPACRAVAIDITESKQLEDAQLFFLQCRAAGTGEDFFKSLSRYLARSLKMDYVCIDRLEGEGLTARTVAIYFDGDFEDNVAYTLKDTPCGDVVGRTICRFDRDVRHLFPQDIVLQDMKAESYVGTTLWGFEGKPIGLIAVISRTPLANPRLAESMLKMAAIRAAGELERQQAMDALLENEKKLQKSHDALEDRVKDRTRALTQSNELLRHEIQERVQADEALRQSQKLASIGLLAAGIAHEINNPNGFIIFNLPILRDYIQELIPIIDDHMADHPERYVFGRPYEEFRKDIFKLLDNIEHGAHRINATVSGLKDFSRKREKPEPRRVALKPVIEHAVSLCRQEIRKNVKSLHLVIPENFPLIRTDPEAIEQILVNILINAAHASNKADSWIKLSVSADGGRSGHCIISVDDNGCGMDEKTVQRIFDPFFTRKTSVQGTGLGLYVCQILAEGLGSRIEVKSQPDQGSSFKIILNDLS